VFAQKRTTMFFFSQTLAQNRLNGIRLYNSATKGQYAQFGLSADERGIKVCFKLCFKPPGSGRGLFLLLPDRIRRERNALELLNDEFYMRLALDLAQGAAGQTGINPAVGCVVVKDGRIVGLGSHLKRGEAHAEVHALQMAGSEAAGATAYVTLEPCSHHGRTPPCCDRLIAERVARVVVAASDPNPQVAGRGIERLRAHGIETEVGLLENRAHSLNEHFRKFIATGRPFVTLKTALTLDGRIATHTGHSRWITGPQAREAVHTLRHRHQAIMAGVETVLADDPELTTRLSVPAQHPIRLIVDSRLRTPPAARVLNGEAATWILTTAGADPASAERLRQAGAELIVCGDGPRVDLEEALNQLGSREIGSVLLEGGGVLNGAMLRAGLVDKLMLFYAAKIVGSEGAPSAFAFKGPDLMPDAWQLERVSIEHYGDDWCVSGYPVSKEQRSEGGGVTGCLPD
jgi:diaminohydroxyphosphoribosylaminopyrimidine deaminase / 5-amino-6-(5-phosphoribosylamino)uracil reductase